MKEQLLERLKKMDDAVLEQNKRLQQANADLNMLNGCRQELIHIINMCDAPVQPKEVERVPCDDANPEAA